jgi:hypothetical protein
VGRLLGRQPGAAPSLEGRVHRTLKNLQHLLLLG